jgi:hypothetical protein
MWLGGNAGIQTARPASFGADGGTRDPALIAMILLLSVVASLVAGYVAAAIARGQELKAAWMLAIVNLVIGVFVQIGLWDAMPVWYHLTFLAMLIPAIVVGGRLRARGASAVA